jgi:hypothetical protein
MRNHKPNASEFTVLLAKGLLWGALAATAAMCGVLLAAAVLSPGVYANPIVFLTIAFYTAVAALILAFIQAPIAALLAWPLYRHSIRERAAYAIAGAAAALPAPIVFQLVSGAWHERGTIEANVVLLAWFAFAGAFGGFMAARYLRQKAS